MKETIPVTSLGLTKVMVTEADGTAGSDFHSPASPSVDCYELKDQEALMNRGSRWALPCIAHCINMQEKPVVEDEDATLRKSNTAKSLVVVSSATDLV